MYIWHFDVPPLPLVAWPGHARFVPVGGAKSKQGMTTWRCCSWWPGDCLPVCLLVVLSCAFLCSLNFVVTTFTHTLTRSFGSHFVHRALITRGGRLFVSSCVCCTLLVSTTKCLFRCVSFVPSHHPSVSRADIADAGAAAAGACYFFWRWWWWRWRWLMYCTHFFFPSYHALPRTITYVHTWVCDTQADIEGREVKVGGGGEGDPIDVFFGVPRSTISFIICDLLPI